MTESGNHPSMSRPSSSSRILPSSSGRSRNCSAVSKLCVAIAAFLSQPYHAAARNLLSRKLLVTTDTLESAIAAEAMIGESNQPVQG